MGLLDGATCYLSGPMEFVADHGVEWRRKFIKLIKENQLQIDCIDPTNKPGGEDVKIGENKDHQVHLQKTGQWTELQKYVHSYRRFDLRFVDISDFLVAVIDPSVPQWGTSNEIYVAESQHKPIFFIIEGGLGNLPRWLFDVIELTDTGKAVNVYGSVEEVVETLLSMNQGGTPLSDEWVLVRKHLEMLRYQNITSRARC